jgi:hypothetical protein
MIDTRVVVVVVSLDDYDDDDYDDYDDDNDDKDDDNSSRRFISIVIVRMRFTQPSNLCAALSVVYTACLRAVRSNTDRVGSL